MKNNIIKIYPNTNTFKYNCYGYALHQVKFLQNSSGYSFNLLRVIEHLKKHGFTPTKNNSTLVSKGKQKIILYGYDNRVEHFARLIRDNICVSKQGAANLVKHEAQYSSGEEYGYGKILGVFERKRR